MAKTVPNRYSVPDRGATLQGCKDVAWWWVGSEGRLQTHKTGRMLVPIKEDCECLGAVAMLLSLTLCMCEFPKIFKGRVYI